MHIKKFASNRTDLTVISELRRKLEDLSSQLEMIDPDVARMVDEDYKVAEHHSLSMAKIAHLQKLAQLLERQVQNVLSGVGKPSAAPRPENSPLLKHLKPTVEDILRNAADDLVREISRPLGFLRGQSSWYFREPLERPLGAMRGQISKETLDAVDPAKKDPTE